MNIYNDFHSIIIQIANKLGLKDRHILDKITSEPPKEKSYGDISTNLALIGSKILNKTPHNLADEIVKELLKLKIVSKALVAGPGFINLHLEDKVWHECCKHALNKKSDYGKNELGKNKKVNIVL